MEELKREYLPGISGWYRIQRSVAKIWQLSHVSLGSESEDDERNENQDLVVKFHSISQHVSV